MIKPPRYLTDFNLSDLPIVNSDAIVIGSGVAGISCAYHLGKNHKVAVLTKSELSLTATRYAQGGIAAAVGEGDNTQSHYDDTIGTGRGLCNEAAVRVLVTEGPAEIETLREIGAAFDRTPDGRLSLTREAGHSRARVVHSKDTTGGEVEARLAATVRGMPRVSIFERVFALDVITTGGRCVGVLAVLNGRLSAFIAPVVVLASGGMGQLYALTTNPPISTGDGLAMAYRAGAVITDIEFVQFHPTALHTNVTPRFLISEAVRGEGGLLKDKAGNRFMVGRHPMAELAPRDVVVREEFARMQETGDDHLYLDCRHLGGEFFKERFPAIYDELKASGIDPAKEMIPVSPAAHYMSGGVKVDLDGRTGIEGLFACGEVACTGVHGANRLASNSLLEGLVFSRRAAVAASTIIDAKKDEPVPRANSTMAPGGAVRANAREVMAELKNKMQDCAGIVRSRQSLDEAAAFLEKNAGFLKPDGPWADDYELSNMLTVANLLVKAAIVREESRGSHWRSDFPKENDAEWLKHIEMKRGEHEWAKLKII